jgi:hypothetical protein
MNNNIQKTSEMGWGTDAYPAQQPQELQFQFDRAQMAQMPRAISQSFNWVVSGKNILVVDPERLDNAFNALGITKEHHGPYALGTVEISHRWTTTFTVQESNVDLDFLFRIFQRWAKYPEVNFERWGHPLHVDSVRDSNGIPLPVKIKKQAADPGVGDQYPNKLWVNTDDDLRTDIQRRYPGQDDMKSTTPNLVEGLYQCAECNEEFDSYPEYLLHMTHDHPKWDPTGPEYEIRDNDEYFYPDNEAVYDRDGGIHTGSVEGPIPFSFDVENDRVYVGEPGEEKVQMDNTNPFGVAEGYYTPEGDLIIVNQPNIPYTVRHLMNLWSYIHPEHEIKHVYLVRDAEGKQIRERVANA